MIAHRPAEQATVFTLIELLVVVAIIAVLVSVLLPALAQARNKAQQATCGGQIRQVGYGLNAYADDNRGHFFPHAGNPGDIYGSSTPYRLELHKYLPNARVFYCPAYTNQRNATTIARFYDPSYTGQFGIDYGVFPGAGSLGWPNPLQNYYIDTTSKVTDASRQVLAADGAQSPVYWPESWGPIDPQWTAGRPYQGNHNGWVPLVLGANRVHFDGHVEWHGRDDLVLGATGGAWEGWLWFW